MQTLLGFDFRHLMKCRLCYDFDFTVVAELLLNVVLKKVPLTANYLLAHLSGYGSHHVLRSKVALETNREEGLVMNIHDLLRLTEVKNLKIDPWGCYSLSLLCPLSYHWLPELTEEYKALTFHCMMQ